jgi:hypothetical protein
MSELTNYQLVNIFKKYLNDFVEGLTDQFPREKDFYTLQLLIKTDQINMENILREFSKVIIPHKDMVLERNEDFFLTKCKTLLSGTDIKSDQVDHFKRIWQSPSLSDDDKVVMWRWFKNFLDIAIQYDKNCKK